MKRHMGTEILKARAGKDSELFVEAVKEICSQLERLEDNARLRSSYKLWQMMFDLDTTRLSGPARSIMKRIGITEALTSAKVKQLLYSLQSYYVMVLQGALINKVCCHVSDHPSSYEELTKRFPGVLHGSELMPFSCWHNDIAFGEELSQKILAISKDINKWPVSGDVARSFYQDIIGSPFRKALGEFYTKDWIAELIMNNVEYAGKGSVLDPGCGSGIFLTKAIQRIIKSNLESGIHSCWDKITKNVVGFDLNPVAVIAAKLNYFLALTELIPEPEDFSSVFRQTSLPIFWANSLIWKAKTNGDEIVLTSPLGVFQVSDNPSEAYTEVHKKLLNVLKENAIEDFPVSGLALSYISPLSYGSFDYVVGNPPWVAPARMTKEYRDHIANLIEDSGYLEPYRPRIKSLAHKLPGKQFSAALPFFAVTLGYYLKERGTCGFLVTSSLLKSLNAGGFRRRITGYHLRKLIDLTPYADIHEGAMCWAFVPIVVKESKSRPKMEYQFYIPAAETLPDHDEKCGEIDSPEGKFHVCSWRIETSRMSSIPSDDRSPWFSAPPRIVNIYRKMMDDEKNQRIGNLYPITRGIVTGADKVYVTRSVTPLSGGERVNVRTGVTGNKGVIVESEVVFPFVQGKHVKKWSFEHTHILLPYQIPCWEIENEQNLRKNFPLLSGYLVKNKRFLEERCTLTIKQRMRRGQEFYVIETRSNLGKSWVLAMKEISPKLETCVIPPKTPTILGDRSTILAHTLNYIPFDSENEAYYLSAILNSSLVKTITYDLGMPKGGYPFKRYDMWMIANLRVPLFDHQDDSCKALVELAHKAHMIKSVNSEAETCSIEEKIDELTANLYGVSSSELKELRRHYDRLSSTIL